MQRKETIFPRLVVVIGFSLLLALSMVEIFPARAAFGQQAQGSNPNWVFAGAFLNYTASSNWSAKLTLSNSSSLSIAGNFTGSVKITVNSIKNGTIFLGETLVYANITATPNFAFKDKITYFNGTAQYNDLTETPSNASTTEVPLSQLNYGNILQSELNATSSLYSFSPHLNATLSVAPGVLYQFNSTTQVPALHLSSSISEQTSIPSSYSSALSGSYSLNGTSDVYVALARDFPLKETITLKGSTTLQNLQLGPSPQGASANGNFVATLTLAATNINLLDGKTVEQSAIQVPNYSTSLDVISNSTIDSAGTSGNQLIVNVTGPSGTTGVLDVVVSPSLLSSAGITSASQVGVAVDGQTYTNYTVTNVGGSYVFTIYYHHSTHKIVMSLGNANLGTNQGSILSVTGQSSSALSSTTILVIAAVLVVVVVVVLVVAFMRRSKAGKMEAPMANAPPPSPTQSQP